MAGFLLVCAPLIHFWGQNFYPRPVAEPVSIVILPFVMNPAAWEYWR